MGVGAKNERVPLHETSLVVMTFGFTAFFENCESMAESHFNWPL